MVSNLGGTPQTLDCPWCEGTGRFVPDHDAQGRFRGEEGSAPNAPEADPAA